MADSDVAVRDNPDRSRYEIWVDGRLAGFAQYRPSGDHPDFVHTEVDDEFEGRGLASELIQQALDDVRRRGWRITASCPFVSQFIGKHPQYEDLLASG